MSVPQSSRDVPAPDGLMSAPSEATRRALYDVAGLYDVASQLLGVRDAVVIASRVTLSAVGTLRVRCGGVYARLDHQPLACLYTTESEWPRTLPALPPGAERVLLGVGVIERASHHAEGVFASWFAAVPDAMAMSAIAYGDELLGVLVLGQPIIPGGHDGLDRHLAAAFAGLAARAMRALHDTSHVGEGGNARDLAERPDVATLQRRSPPLRAFHGSSAALRDLCQQLVAVAPSPCAVLLTGARGSGRSLAARVLHQLSPRAGAPFTEIDCDLLPPPLLERALWGVAGDAGGAPSPGLCRVHEGGTVVLARAEALAPSTQAGVARLLQYGLVTRVGEQRAERVDVRLLALADGDVRGEGGRGRLREDLAYRLSAFHVRVPSLAEREEDVPAIVAQLLARAADRQQRPSWQVTPEALRAIRRLRCPGQIGQLARLTAALARLAAHDTRLTALHVETAAAEVGDAEA